MIRLRPSRPEDGARVLEIWVAAVDDTHDFLAPEDGRERGRGFEPLPPAAPLTGAAHPRDRPLGFLLIREGRLEALYVDPEHHDAGIGRMLIEYALAVHPLLELDVHDQNVRALGFYRHMGFDPVGWSATDGRGRPYPLVHMRFGD